MVFRKDISFVGGHEPFNQGKIALDNEKGDIPWVDGVIGRRFGIAGQGRGEKEKKRNR